MHTEQQEEQITRVEVFITFCGWRTLILILSPLMQTTLNTGWSSFIALQDKSYHNLESIMASLPVVLNAGHLYYL